MGFLRYGQCLVTFLKDTVGWLGDAHLFEVGRKETKSFSLRFKTIGRETQRKENISAYGDMNPLVERNWKVSNEAVQVSNHF